MQTVERFTGLGENGRPTSRLVFVSGGCRVRITIEDLRQGPERKRQSKRLRRTVALAIFRFLRPLVGVRPPHFAHLDQLNLDTRADADRKGDLYEAPRLETPLERFGFEVRLQRLNLGLTQKELAQRAGLSVKHLVRLEQGRFVPRAATLKRLNDALRS